MKSLLPFSEKKEKEKNLRTKFLQPHSLETREICFYMWHIISIIIIILSNDKIIFISYSFRDFWLGTDQNARQLMSREKTDAVLKVVVKHFFIEREVTSTLVMDSLYSGLKALEGHTKCKKGKAKLLDSEEMPAPIVHIEKDTFVLVDDVLLLLERTAMESLPPKDEDPQNHTKVSAQLIILV